MSQRRFDAVLIDFYGTISAGDRAAVEATCRRIVHSLGLPLSPVELSIRWGEAFFAAVDAKATDGFRTLYECEVLSLQQTLSPYARAADAALFVADLEAYWRDPPLHADAVGFLRDVDVPICCVSNADTAPLMSAIEKHGLRFDAVVSSESVRSYKPKPEIFRRALSLLNVTADRAVHVGDSLHSDVSGAAGVGLTTVWLRREERIHDIGACEADHSIGSLSELSRLLSA